MVTRDWRKSKAFANQVPISNLKFQIGTVEEIALEGTRRRTKNAARLPEVGFLLVFLRVPSWENILWSGPKTPDSQFEI
jgi:hypothetical protein